ncbi:MAG: hypothetical protein RRY35_04775, partial [Clostridiales bacterium]
MKKIMTMILMLAVVLGLVVLTGCNQDVSTDDPQTNVKDYENLDEMNQQLDVNLNVPAGAEKAQFNIVDGKIAQSDYYVDDIHYVVRVTKGQQDNLSGISVNEKFTNDETA